MEQKHEEKKKIVVATCIGASNTGVLAGRVATDLCLESPDRFDMLCLPAYAIEKEASVKKVQNADRILVVEGCPVRCASAILRRAGRPADLAVEVSGDYGVKKMPVLKCEERDVSRIKDDLRKRTSDWRMQMDRLKIDHTTCTQCSICVDICPNNALELRDDRPELVHPELCTACGVCEDQCLSRSIVVLQRPHLTTPVSRPSGGPVCVSASEQMVSLLGLTKPPVGMKLVREGNDVPAGFTSMDFPIRHCVSIHMASLGAAIHVPASQHACAAGKAAIGVSDLPEKVKSGKVPYMHGLASSEHAAARIMAEIPKLPAGTCSGTLVAPLSSFDQPPEVVILTCPPKQAMWVANSLLFKTGGPRITANFAGMQASCGDITALPILTGNVNFSLGCYGCRSAGKLKDDEMYVGIPGSRIDEVVAGLLGLRRAMGKLETAQVGSTVVGVGK